jgi:DNA-binding GntR family transcriptional regulator
MNLIIGQNKKTDSARNFAYQVLLSNILQWNLRPGEVIKDSHISELLGISRTPVREALVALRDDKLVTVYSSNKSCVALIDSQLVYEGMYIRSNIESSIAVDICGKLSDVAKSIMKENLSRQRYVAEGNIGSKSFFELDNIFHKIFYDIAGKDFTYRMIKKSCYHLNRMRYYTYQEKINDMEHLYHTHEEIFSCLADNNPVRLKELVTQHVFDNNYGSSQSMPKSLHLLAESRPEYFSVRPEEIIDRPCSIQLGDSTYMAETLL